MANSKVAIRYALSFLDTSIEKNVVDQVSKDLQLIYNAFIASKELSNAMKSPIIKSETKQKVFEEIFAAKIEKDAKEYFNFVLFKGRIDLLTEILQMFFDLKDDRFGIANVHVTTAFDLASDQKSMLEEKFAKVLNKKVHITFSIDEKIIGGFLAKVRDTVYDASVSHQLDLLKKEFLHGSALLN